MQQYGVSQNEAHNMIESNDARSTKVWDGIVKQELGNAVAAVSKGEQYVNDRGNADKLNFALENQNKVNNQNVQDVTQKAADRGLDQNQVRQSVQNKGNELQNKQKDITTLNDEKYSHVKAKNKNINQDLRKTAQKYEEDRIGQGKAGQTFGIGGPTVQHINNKDK